MSREAHENSAEAGFTEKKVSTYGYRCSLRSTPYPFIGFL